MWIPPTHRMSAVPHGAQAGQSRPREPGRTVPRAEPTEQRRAGDATSTQSLLPSLSTSMLVWLWRATYAQLQRPPSPTETRRILRLRRECVDVLEAREPVAFHEWLRSSAGAGADASLSPMPGDRPHSCSWTRPSP
jgi:hypothetical protein